MSETEYHDCFQNSKLESCDGEIDKRKCVICGKEWTERCNFDDNFQ